MYSKEHGFILQACSGQEQQVSLLTQSRGKLKIMIKMPRQYGQLSPGTLIAFSIQGERFLHAQDVEILSVPVVQSKRDIAWVHHWLELASYFSQPELFDEVLFKSLSTYFVLLSRDSFLKRQSTLGIFCVFHFLHQTGFYEDNLFISYKKIIDVITSLSSWCDFDEILNDLEQSVNKLTINEIEQIEFFILQSLQKHPFFRMFKTVRFVYPVQVWRNYDGR